jgi:hypothetical protein
VNLLAAPLDTDGHVRGAATRMAAGVVGWHALELEDGVGLSTVTPAPAPAPATKPTDRPLIREKRPGGALAYRAFDAEARPAGPTVPITAKPIVSGDVEVARRGSSLVFAWTDRTAEEPAVAMASIDMKDAKPHAGQPRRLIEARGGASLLSLAAGPAGVAVMFEAPVRRKGESRRVHLAKIGAGDVLERPSLALDVVGRGQAELAPTGSGFAVLATTPDCDADSPACANADAVATVIRTDDKMTIVQREPLTFTADPATLGWGLSCDDETCIALAASPSGPGSPSRIRTAVIKPRPGAKVAAAKPGAATRPTSGAHVTDVTAIASGESVVDLASTHLGGSDLVALLSVPASADGSSTSATSGASGPARTNPATLTTRTVSATGEVGAPNVISARALPVGGVAIAAGEKPDDGAAVAYVARQGGDPEVRVARLDKQGKRTADVQLTAAKGDASDVTITWAGGGFIVAWVDSRDGNGEVYAARLTSELVRTSREERLTTAPGDASDLVALPVGQDVWLAWADPRESPRDGVADVYVTAVKMKDAKRSFDEQRVMATAAHSRTPHLTAGRDNVQIAWIEEAPLGAETPSASGYGAFWAKLDPQGKPTDRPVRLGLAGEGAATSVALDTSGPTRAVIARSTADGISLDGVDLSTAPPRVSALLALDGPPSLDVALALGSAGDKSIVYFNDDGPAPVDRRARRARIEWNDVAASR